MSAPPKNAPAKRFSTLEPKRQLQSGGTLCSVRSPLNFALAKAPMKMPTTSIHSQSIFGGFPSSSFFWKYGFVVAAAGWTV